MEKRLDVAEKIALAVLIGLIPAQMGRHWWPEWSLVGGIRVDYLSPTLYLADMAWMMWAAIRVLRGERKSLGVNKWWVILAMVNVLVAGNKVAAVMGWARWWQWWTVIKWVAGNKETVKNMLLKIVPVWVLVEAGLGLAQVAGGGSVGGVFWLLGERRFSLNSIGAPLWGLGGQEWVRAVGTFSHPNSLAGFSLLLAGWWWLVRGRWTKDFWGRAAGVATMAGLGLIMFLTASRTVWLMGAGLGAAGLVKYGNMRQKIGIGLLGLGAVVVALGVVAREYELKYFVGGWDRDSVEKRWELMVEAKKMIGTNMVAGVGLNNWWNQQTVNQGGSGWRQPVHNILALWWAETGLVGMGVGLGTMYKWYQRKKMTGWVVVAIIVLASGMVDHYWLTLPQNRWLWGIIWAII